jgi:hypothetical protein
VNYTDPNGTGPLGAIIGAIVGAILGSEGGPPGVAAGAAEGAVIGSALEDAISGESTTAPPPQPAPDCPDPNALHHIFDNPNHNLDPVVEAYGSQADAYNAIQQALDQQLGSGSGLFKTMVTVGGYDVTVTGAYVNGAPNIGTAYIPR